MKMLRLIPESRLAADTREPSSPRAVARRASRWRAAASVVLVCSVALAGDPTPQETETLRLLGEASQVLSTAPDSSQKAIANGTLNLLIQQVTDLPDIENPPPPPPPPPVDPGTPVTVTATHFVTAMGDKVPRFVRDTNVTHTSVVNGDWCDPATWGGSVPGPESRVMVAAGTMVTLACADIDFHSLQIDGGAIVSPEVDVAVKYHDIQIHPSGVVIVETEKSCRFLKKTGTCETGTVESPGIDPDQWGEGVVNFGRWIMRGREVTPAVRLSVEPQAGDLVLHLASAPDGWEEGGEIVVPDTAQNDSTKETEERRIVSVDGADVTLDAPLQFGHRGSRNADGSVCDLPHVFYLTRNIVFDSESIDTPNRYHTADLGRAEDRCYFARFSNGGRTMALARHEGFDSTTRDSEGRITHIGDNQNSRYGRHRHHDWGPVNPENEGYQTEEVGCVVDNAGKWGEAIHGSHYGLYTANVIYKAQSDGIFIEDGTESFNEIRGNYIINPGQNPVVTFKGHRHTGIWMSSANNYVDDNVIVGVDEYSAFTAIGLAVWTRNNDVPGRKNPKFRGANMMDPAQFVAISPQDQPLLSCRGNEVYGCRHGAQLMYGDNPTTIEGGSLWNNAFGVSHYVNTGAHVVRGIRITGDERPWSSAYHYNQGVPVQSIGVGDGHGRAHAQRNVTVEDCLIQNVAVGVSLPQANPTLSYTIRNNDFRTRNTAICVTSRSGSKAVVIDNCKFGGVSNPGNTNPWGTSPLILGQAIVMLDDNGTTAIADPFMTTVTQFDGVAGDDFHVYFPRQPHPCEESREGVYGGFVCEE